MRNILIIARSDLRAQFNSPVAYVVKHGKAIFQGDIILEKVDPLGSQGPRPSSGVDSVGVTYSQYLWPKVGNQYQIPYIINLRLEAQRSDLCGLRAEMEVYVSAVMDRDD